MIKWSTKSTEKSEFNKKFKYLTEPSQDQIKRFKREIGEYDDPTKHKAFQPCDSVEAENNLLFILMRVEVLIRIDYEHKKLRFVDCNDV